MKRFHASACAAYLGVMWTATAESHVFTDTSGRKVTAELLSVSEESIRIQRNDGKIFTIAIDTLIEDDRDYVEEWNDERTEEAEREHSEAEAARLAIEKRAKVGEFCTAKIGVKVGNGECWTLADEAYKSCGARRPGGDLRVWGREIDLKKEELEPGDVVEFRTAAIAGYGTSGPEHTAVVVKGGRRGRATIAEQNWGGNKTVRTVEIDLRKVDSGKVMVYRLEKG
ncbi:SHD1 domain-containing protein [Luteolibacter marinus]|uniref:SHD1 domain-containing protein n=1 Tax=Luteolibacter marinus TaxID=2776705 RepID=UPI0018683521|nr:SHD1 domain-containing protein [Luteolibacter marinus]